MPYTKSDLERLLVTQQENLTTMNDLLSIMKLQNELLHNANKKLKDEIAAFKQKHVIYSTQKRVKTRS